MANQYKVDDEIEVIGGRYDGSYGKIASVLGNYLLISSNHGLIRVHKDFLKKK